MKQDVDTAEADVEELLKAIEAAKRAAALAYEFSSGNGYAYSAMQACNKVAKLAGK